MGLGPNGYAGASAVASGGQVSLLEGADAAWCLFGPAAAFAIGWRMGRAALRRQRRARMALPELPSNGGIMALVPALPTTCPGCGRRFDRHPATTEKRCGVCVANAFDQQEAEDLARLRTEGWGR